MSSRVIAFAALIVLTIPLNAVAAGYNVCLDTATNQTKIQCKGSCPAGTTFVSYNPADHSSCDKEPGSGGDYDYRPGAEQCHASMNLNNIGYKGGHKTRYCINHGYDGNNGWMCFRDCKTSCVRAALDDLAWSKNQGSKSDFCKNLGYDGTNGAAGSDYTEAGYCYKKVTADCRI